MGESYSRITGVRAILLDLHETITEVHEDIPSITRRVSHAGGVDLSNISDDQLNIAMERVIEWINPYQLENDVDIRFGSEVEHWTQANRIMYEALGIEGLSDEELNFIEQIWKEEFKSWEEIRPDAISTLTELKNRGYVLGICTRRTDDPTELLQNWGILNLLSTVQWTSVPGYSKPFPYTLILAAEEIAVNPLRCAFVGNRVDADIDAAVRAGMVPVLTTWADPEEAKKAPQGTHIIREISELLELFPKK
jgi:phosphoglycolate phosphatase-like HAD superfamily hydrolase